MLSSWRAGHHLGTFDYLISGRQRQSDCDIKRPHDLESLEYGEDIVVYLEALTRRLPSEISAMGIEPPVSRAGPPLSQANASSTWKSRLIVTSVVRQMNRGYPSPSSMMTKSPGRCRLATLTIVACQTGRSPFRPAITKSANSVVISGLSPNEPTT
jgi:hypothetical protein